MSQCTHILDSGEPCSNPAVPGTSFCERHRGQRILFRPVPTPSKPPAPPESLDEPPVAVEEAELDGPDWIAQPHAMGATPAFPGVYAEARNVL